MEPVSCPKVGKIAQCGTVCAVTLILAFSVCRYAVSSQRVSASEEGLVTAADSHYQVIDLGTLSADNWSEANGINDQGQVLCTAGIRKAFDPHIVNSRAFLWESGQRRDLGMLAPDPISQGVALNNQGQVLGITSLSDAINSSTRIFLWHNGKMHDLNTLSLPGREPHALSDQGEIVGEAFPPKQTEAKTAFLWTAGKGRYLGLPFPSTANAVVHGRATDPILIAGEFQGNGFLWRNGKLTKLRVPGSWGTQLRAVNTSGQSVGCVSLPTGHSHALLWQNGRFTDLGILAPRQDSIAVALNDKGMIVGWATTAPDNSMHAALWNGKTIKDLNDEISTIPPIILSSAKGINNHNQIICDGYPANESNNEHQHAYLLIPR